MDLGDINFMSADVNDERTPKGLTCPTITAVPDVETAAEGCPLCDNPRTSEIAQRKPVETQGVSPPSVGISAVKLAQTPVDDMMAAAEGGPGVRGESNTRDKEDESK